MAEISYELVSPEFTYLGIVYFKRTIHLTIASTTLCNLLNTARMIKNLGDILKLALSRRSPSFRLHVRVEIEHKRLRKGEFFV